ncbi:hypothetical protein ACFL54_07765 [Planctomycetota bacterium]
MIAASAGQETAIKAKTILHGNNDANALGQLITMAADRDHVGRSRIIRRLAKIESPLSCLALRKIAADVGDPERVLAIRGLATLNDQTALPLLEHIAKQANEDRRIRDASQKAMAKIQSRN